MKEKKIKLSMSTNKISIKWVEGTEEEDKKRILGKEPFLHRNDLRNKRYRTTVIEIDTIAGLSVFEIIESLLSFPQVEISFPLYYTEENDTMILTNEIIVKLKPSQILKNMEERYEIKLVRKDPYDERCMVFKVLKNSRLNVFEIANLINESELVEYASPNFILKIVFYKTPNDNYYSNQWGLAKIRANLAWEFGK